MPAITRRYFEERAAWLNSSTICKESNCPLSGIHIHSSLPCNSADCPIKHPHKRGRYLHEGKFARQQPWPNSNEGGPWNGTWGSNNPPPEIWLAYFRQRAGLATSEDVAVIHNFVARHMFIDLTGHGRGDFC